MRENGKRAVAKTLPIVNQNETTLVYVEEIAFMEKNLRFLNFYIYEDKINLIHSVYGKIEDYLKYLDDSFYRVHNSCIINLNMVKSINNGKIIFMDGTVLIVGINSYQKTRKRYKDFIKTHC